MVIGLLMVPVLLHHLHPHHLHLLHLQNHLYILLIMNLNRQNIILYIQFSHHHHLLHQFQVALKAMAMEIVYAARTVLFWKIEHVSQWAIFVNNGINILDYAHHVIKVILLQMVAVF